MNLAGRTLRSVLFRTPAESLKKTPPSLHGAHQGEFVRMFKPTAGGQSLGDACEAAVFTAKKFREIVRGGLTFDIRTQSEDDFDFLGGGIDAPE